jgi:hypothetical protein
VRLILEEEKGMRMRNLTMATACVVSLGWLLFGVVLGQDKEQRVKMKDLPQAVQKTVKEQSQGATIRGFAKEVENGKTYYEVELKVNGHNKDILMDPAGAVVEIEEEVVLSALPPAVREGIAKHVGKGKIRNVESVTKNGAVVAYEAHVKTGKKSSEVKVGPDGQLIKD